MKYLTTPSELYYTSEFRGLRALLMDERQDEDGNIICAYCGKVIYAKYYCIAHHIIEETPQNMNDTSITLNPENIQLIHHKCHNIIHKRFGGQILPWQRKVYYVWGAPCSGKSTYVQELAERGDMICDIDRIWECVSGQPCYIKPNELKANVFQIRDTMLDQIKTRTGKWGTAWIIEGGAREADRKRRIELLGAESIFIDTDKETCLQRLANDKARANVQALWQGYINDWFNDYRLYSVNSIS